MESVRRFPEQLCNPVLKIPLILTIRYGRFIHTGSFIVFLLLLFSEVKD